MAWGAWTKKGSWLAHWNECIPLHCGDTPVEEAWCLSSLVWATSSLALDNTGDTPTNSFLKTLLALVANWLFWQGTKHWVDVSFLGYNGMPVCLHGSMSSQTSITTQLKSLGNYSDGSFLPLCMYFNNVTVWEELFLQVQAPYFIPMWWKASPRPNWKQVWVWWVYIIVHSSKTVWCSPFLL